MEPLTLLGLVALTSAGAFVIGRRRLALSPGRLGVAVGKAFETAGLVLFFLAFNIAVGGALILGLRAVTSSSLSLYVLTSDALLLLSALQALAFQHWREEVTPRPPNPVGEKEARNG